MNFEWLPLNENKDLLKDHYWYLVAHSDYKTPMKAKYHNDVPHFVLSTHSGEETTYIFENKISHFMPLPDLPNA